MHQELLRAYRILSKLHKADLRFELAMLERGDFFNDEDLFKFTPDMVLRLWGKEEVGILPFCPSGDTKDVVNETHLKNHYRSCDSAYTNMHEMSLQGHRLELTGTPRADLNGTILTIGRLVYFNHLPRLWPGGSYEDFVMRTGWRAGFRRKATMRLDSLLPWWRYTIGPVYVFVDVVDPFILNVPLVENLFYRNGFPIATGNMHYIGKEDTYYLTYLTVGRNWSANWADAIDQYTRIKEDVLFRTHRQDRKGPKLRRHW